MVRTFIILLLLAVFFLAGTLYGMNQTANSTEGNIDQINESENIHEKEEMVKVVPNHHKPMEKQELVAAPVVEQDLIAMDNQTHLTQKTASLLEASVQGFYEIVVGVLYGVAEMFF